MENKELIKENASLRLENVGLRAKVERLEKESADMRTELQGLRRIIFNRIHGDEEDGLADNSVEFPYRVKRRVVIVGGHDSWSKAIRPLLQNVRFVEKETVIDVGLIKKADVIWIQTNALTHAQYDRIKAIARVSETEIRYFTSASAEKCARAVAMEDMQ